MVRPIVRALAVAAALASGAAADEPPPPGPDQGRAPRPDLSARPRDADPLLLALEGDPELRARADAGTRMIRGGAALVALGGFAVPIGMAVLVADAWSSGYGTPAGTRTNPRGAIVVGAGAAALIGGAALVVAGGERRDDALRTFEQRRRAGRPAP